MTDTATVHRYQGHDEARMGIPDGTLIACLPADYDDEKWTILFTLPDLRDPQCSAYLQDVGPELTTIEVVDRGEEPWGMVPADPAGIPAVVEAAEKFEQDAATEAQMVSAVAEAITQMADDEDVLLPGAPFGSEVEWHLECDSDPTLLTATEYDGDSRTGRHVVFRLVAVDIQEGIDA